MIDHKKSREERTSHVDLESPCEVGGIMDRNRLASFLGLNEPPTDMPMSCLCGTGCSNPKHWAFVFYNESRWAATTAKKNRIRLVLKRYGNELSVAELARLSHTSRQMVTKYLKEESIDRTKVLGKDGRKYRAHYS